MSGEPLREPLGRKISIIVRSLIFNILFYVNLIGLLLVGWPSIFFDRHKVFFFARAWGRTSLWLLEKICGTQLQFRGLENIPAGSVIVAAKHQSILETFALTLHTRDFSYVLKRELMWIPFFGWFLKGAEQIGIDRASGTSALNRVAERAAVLFREGRALFIFPEGTRRNVNAPPKYKHGVTHFYTTLNMRVLPVALNTGLFWPRRSFLRKPGLCVIEYLPLIEPGLDKDVFSELVQNVIETATNELVAEALRNDPYLAAH